MYCPNCATPINGTRFCRACGANVSQVPQALTGNLPAAPAGRHAERPPSIDRAAGSLFTGIAFILVSLGAFFFAPAGRLWWFWLLIPAFASLGRGVSEYWKLREQQRRMELMAASRQQQPAMPPRQATPEIGAPGAIDTSDLAQPPSITEQTTRHLERGRGE